MSGSRVVGRGRGLFAKKAESAQPAPGITSAPARSENTGFGNSHQNNGTVKPSGGGTGWEDDGWGNNDSSFSTAPAPTGGFGDSNRGFGGNGGSFNGGNRGGGGGMTCYKCNQEGHMSRECPNADTRPARGGGGTMTCYKCNEEGHMSRECPKGGGGGGGMTCYKCQEEGHMSRDCPKGGGGGGGGRACYKCQEEGHMARDCPNPDTRPPRDGGGGGTMTCYKCNEEGHMSRDCPKGGGGGGGRACYKCQEEGHMARDCPNPDTRPPKDGGGGGGGGGACYKCQQEGHMARDCPNAEADDGERKPRACYIPDADDEDEMPHINAGINFDNYEKIPVDVTGDNPPGYIRTFADAKFPPEIMKTIEKLNYMKPTPVQKYGIPIIANGRDLMACAQTGSGKTAAFLLPIMARLIDTEDYHEPSVNARAAFPRVLIMGPTRELVKQIHTNAVMFARGTKLRCRYTYGGLDVNHNYNELKAGCDILVATPGRLLDFIQKVWIHLQDVKFFVLDEADRMLHMDGFHESVQRVVAEFKGEKQPQVMMFSATFPQEVQCLARNYLKDYLYLVVGMVGSANQDVTQTIIEVSGAKLDMLLSHLESMKDQKTLVFVETKRTADYVGAMLCQKNYPTTTIHGDRLQAEREEALKQFVRGKSCVMVATSVAARGLDIPKVDNVINMDLPSDVDTYVHRIGRTGRAGNTGRAISFYESGSRDDQLAAALTVILKEAQQEVPEFLSSYGGLGGYQSRGTRDTRSGVQGVRYEHTNDDGFLQGGSNVADMNQYTSQAVESFDDDAW